MVLVVTVVSLDKILSPVGLALRKVSILHSLTCDEHSSLVDTTTGEDDLVSDDGSDNGDEGANGTGEITAEVLVAELILFGERLGDEGGVNEDVIRT